MKTAPRVAIWTGILLVAINVLLFNLLLDQAGALRIDVTEGDVYSLSPVTERLIASLDEQVTIHAIFSRIENLHEDLRPFVPQIRDLLRELEERSDGQIRVVSEAPEDDPEVEKRAQNRFGLQPQAFAYSEQNQRGVRSFYFGLAVEYAGARPETIRLPDLVDSGNVFGDEQRLHLRNVEFSVSRAIKRAVFGFENQRGVFSRFDGRAVLKTWISPKEKLPAEYEDTPERVEKVFREIAAESDGKLTYEPQPIPQGEEAQRALLREEGIRQILFPFQDEAVYLWALIEVDGKAEGMLDLVGAGGSPSEFELRERIEDFFRKRTPGFLPTVGIVQITPPPPNPMMGMNQPQQRSPYSSLQAAIARDHEVRSLDPTDLRAIPAGIDVLVVTGNETLSDDAVYAIDQYVMRGGKAIFLVDGSEVEIAAPMTLRAKSKPSGLEDLLASWGVEIVPDVVIDPEHGGDFFWTVGGELGTRPTAADFRWGALPVVGESSGSVNRDVSFLGSFVFARFWFPSHLRLTEVEGVESTWLFRSSDSSWTSDPALLGDPLPKRHPKTGYERPPGAEESARTFAALLQGRLTSYWKDRAIPAAAGGDESEAMDDAEDDAASEAAADGEAEPDAEPAKKPLATAPMREVENARVIVVADDEFVDDMQAAISQQFGAPIGAFSDNARMVLDMIDWMLEDDDLIAIRNRGRSHRPLEKLEPEELRHVQMLNFVGPLAALALLALGVTMARSLRRPTLRSGVGSSSAGASEPGAPARSGDAGAGAIDADENLGGPRT